MAFAHVMAHAPQGNPLLPLTNQGEPAVLFRFVILFLATQARARRCAWGPGLSASASWRPSKD